MKNGEAALTAVPSYEDYLGRWSDDKSGLVLTVSQKVKGSAYSISGLNGQGAYPVEAVFEEGRLVVYEQFVSSDGGARVALQGGDGSNPSYPGSNLGVLFSAVIDEAGEKMSVFGANGYSNYAFNQYVNQGYNSSYGSGGIPASMGRFVLFYEDFEQLTEDAFDKKRTRIDKNNDDSNWYLERGSGQTHSGSVTMASPSLDRWNHTAFKPNKWAFTPPIQLSDTDCYVSFWVTAQSETAISEHYAVYVTDTKPTKDNLSDCTKLLEQTYPNGNPVEIARNYYKPDGYQRYVIRIPSKYNGKTVYIGFRHFDCSGQFWLNIDDVSVFQGKPQ